MQDNLATQADPGGMTAPIYRILIVDDSPEDRFLYKRLLKRDQDNQFDIVEVENAWDGLAYTQKNLIDCVLLDYNLPDASGINFIESFKQQSLFPDAAIVMITGQVNTMHAVTAMKEGAQDYLSKGDLNETIFVKTVLNAIERSRLQGQVRRYQKDLEKSNQSLSEFTHTVSHDLKAPLRRMISFSALLQDSLGDGLSEETADYLDRIVTNAKRLQRFVDDLLAFSKAMDAQEEKADLDLAQLVEEARGDLEPLIEENHANIVVAPLPAIKAYPLRVRQLFLNLISNAIKYHSDKNPVIEIGTAQRDGATVFFVKDNGLGIAPEFHNMVFAAFQRLHSQDSIEGTGLGLSICKKVVDMHGGRIWVESAPGSGSTFYFTLPQA